MPAGYSCNGGTYVGEAADWIFERYGSFRLANFGNSYMQYNFGRFADRNSSLTCPYEESLKSSGAQWTDWQLWGSTNCGGDPLAQSWYWANQSHGVEILMEYLNYQ